MPLAFVIELRSQTVGLAVRDGTHYRFHSVVQEFSRLDGQSFRSPQEAERAIRRQQVLSESSFRDRPKM